jgi:hypothetical protein
LRRFIVRRIPASPGSGRFALTASYEKLLADLRGEHVFLLLKPGNLSFQVTHTPLEAAHFGDNAGIRPADVVMVRPIRAADRPVRGSCCRR